MSQARCPQTVRATASVEDDVGRAAGSLEVELMHVPEPADRSYVVSVRRQLADAHAAARFLLEDLPPSGGLDPRGEPVG